MFKKYVYLCCYKADRQSEFVCLVWSPVNDVDALWNETVGAQSLDTDTHGDTEVQVLQNTLPMGDSGEKCSAWIAAIKSNTSAGRENKYLGAGRAHDRFVEIPIDKNLKNDRKPLQMCLFFLFSVSSKANIQTASFPDL